MWSIWAWSCLFNLYVSVWLATERHGTSFLEAPTFLQPATCTWWRWPSQQPSYRPLLNRVEWWSFIAAFTFYQLHIFKFKEKFLTFTSMLSVLQCTHPPRSLHRSLWWVHKINWQSYSLNNLLIINF